MIDITERKYFEEAHLENELRLSEVIDLSSAGYFCIDRAGCFQRVNSAWLRLHGYDSPDEVIGRHFLMVQVEDDQQAAQRFVDRMFAGVAIPSNGLFSRRCKDGSIGFHTFSVRPFMQRGEIVGLEGFIIDCTDQQRIEVVREFLAKTSSGVHDEPFFNTLARFLAQNLDMDFVCIDRLEGDGLHARTVAVWGDGHFEDNSTYALTDTPCGEVVVKTICCFPANVCQLFPRDQVLQEMRAESYIGVTLFGHTGRPIGLIACVGRGPLVNRSLAEAIMTLVAVRAAGEMERLEAETALRESEEKYRTLFREMLEGCALHEIICDAEGHPVDYRFLAVNPAFERLTGLKGEEITGRTVLEVLPDIEPFWIETYGKVALSGEPASFEHYSTDLKKYFEVTAFQPTQNQFSCILEDITERKRAEEERINLETQLHQAQKMESVGRLAGGVAHDFNNMLGVILGHACLVLMEMAPSHPYHANLEEIRKATERSADLTRQLLVFARKQAIAPITLDMNSTVAGMLKMLQRLIGENIDLTWHPRDGLWAVKVDQSQIDQILANLCVNARDAITDVGRITIETENCTLDEGFCALHAGSIPGEYVRLTVCDNGCGMDKETQDQIFDPFFTTKGVGKGTGLGLSMVYGAVKQNNGYIDVYSEPGQGTTFTIYLPRHVDESANVSAAGPNMTPTGGQEIILVVEDEPTLLKMTSKMLENQGYTVIQAGSPDTAILLAGEHAGEIQLLVTDVVMPDMNGRDLANTLLSRFPNMKRVYMSGYTADVIAPHGVLEEGVHFIQKPFTVTDLAAKVREALDG
ncbi:MAG: PAS domain S-box protein [Desulfuromonadales bacterium]|nr:PAS domain S-box protein [Desulfuromonadales bacterium]